MLGNEIGNEHQKEDYKSFPECGEITGNKTGEDIQGCATMSGGTHDFLYMT
ncbi:MAG: hypothetical protein A4E58_01333 [Syntrophorhabdus sp. PtaB.Bin006]|nr:MAG: hypothetical protein A4E58_01333 [Syntrophorhabdus sp. PtaB.Bin006]